MKATTIIPELVIYKILEQLLKFIRDDYNETVNKDETILHQIFDLSTADGEKNELGNFDWLKQAKEVFLRTEESPRLLSFNMGYNIDRLKIPTIHIMLPTESPTDSPIGGNQGYSEPVISGDKMTWYPVFTQNNSVQYTLLITSDNMNEVLLVYTMLKYMFLSLKVPLELKGFQNVKFGGTDVFFQDDLVPPSVYHRNFSLSFSYDYSARDLMGQKVGKFAGIVSQMLDIVASAD